MSDDMETGPDLPEEPLDETTAYAPLDEEPEEAGPPLSGRGKDERMWGMACHLSGAAILRNSRRVRILLASHHPLRAIFFYAAGALSP